MIHASVLGKLKAIAVVSPRAFLVATITVMSLCLAPPRTGHAQEDWRYTNVPRVVAVGDVHGATDSLIELMKLTGLINDTLQWIGEDAHFVSLGDLLDRGPDSRAAMDLLIRLQSEAQAAGGRVHVVLGNHEVMNLMGDLRYVAYEEFAAFADEEPPGAREDTLQAFALDRGGEIGDTNLQAEFDQRYPPGYFGHRTAFGTGGKYGEWIANLPAIIVVNDVAYTHGGLSTLVAETGLDINEQIQSTLRDYLALRGQLVATGLLPPYEAAFDTAILERELSAEQGDRPDLIAAARRYLELLNEAAIGNYGPLWYRGALYCNPLIEEAVLEAGLERLSAQSLVVGHTPTTDGRAHALFDGRLTRLDTGMLTDYYGGRAAAVVTEGGERYVQYASPAERASIESRALLAYGLGEEVLLEALAEAPIDFANAGADQPITLTWDGIEIRARLISTPSDAARHEMAAYLFDQLLGFDLVPPTVEREVNGARSAVQLIFPGSQSEADRVSSGGAVGWCALPPQFQLLYAFDALTFNTGRSRDNVSYRDGFSRMVLTDHAQAFGTRRQLPDGLDQQPPALPPRLIESIKTLDAETLNTVLGMHLDRRQIRAITARIEALADSL